MSNVQMLTPKREENMCVKDFGNRATIFVQVLEAPNDFDHVLEDCRTFQVLEVPTEREHVPEDYNFAYITQ